MNSNTGDGGAHLCGKSSNNINRKNKTKQNSHHKNNNKQWLTLRRGPSDDDSGHKTSQREIKQRQNFKKKKSGIVDDVRLQWANETMPIDYIDR